MGEYKWENVLEKHQILKGEFRNYYKPNIYAVGYIGKGKYNSKSFNGVVYKVWSELLRRCYSETNESRNIAYKDCEVSKDWHNFQNFAEWYVNHEFFGFGYEIDKDLLLENNKIYCPTYCTMLPKSLNIVISSLDRKNGALPQGVRFDRNKYDVRIQKDGIRKSIGRFNSLSEAAMAYNSEKGEELCELAKKYEGSITKESYLALLDLGKKLKIKGTK